MEVLPGPTFSIEVPPPTAFVRPATGKEPEIPNALGSGFGALGSGTSPAGVSSESSSSIGIPDADSDDDAGDEAQSESEGRFCTLDSLADSLPVKRGLSNHFAGKSKSFANLSEVAQVKDLVKPENAFNKRRRILMAAKCSRKSSFYDWPNPKSMPLLALREDEEGESAAQDVSNAAEESERESEEDEDEEEEARRRNWRFHDRKLQSLKSKSCFDLQEYQQL